MTASESYRSLLVNATLEVLPFKSLDEQLMYIQPGARVSVTCSPNKGNDHTLVTCEKIKELGFQPIPHISARMIESTDHVKRIAAEFRRIGITDAFIVGGDAEIPGPYPDGESFLAALLAEDHGLTTIGIPAYPDGHASISEQALHDALLAKQRMIRRAGLNGWASTQMCFDTRKIVNWLQQERDMGFNMPVHLGVPGVVEKTKLMKISLSVGVGTSLRFLRKNRKSLGKLLTSASYNPDDLLEPISKYAERLNIESLHVFTFNSLKDTIEWRNEKVSELRAAV
jgi:methylenetetrahydrofolate reductase (NADPH)